MISLEELTEEKVWDKVLDELYPRLTKENIQFAYLQEVRNMLIERIREELPDSTKWFAEKLEEQVDASLGLVGVAMYLIGLSDAGVNAGISVAQIRDSGLI